MIINENGKGVAYGEQNLFVNTIGQLVQSRTVMFILCENTIGAIFYYLMALRKRIVPMLLDVRISRGAAAIASYRKFQ